MFPHARGCPPVSVEFWWWTAGRRSTKNTQKQKTAGHFLHKNSKKKKNGTPMAVLCCFKLFPGYLRLVIHRYKSVNMAAMNAVRS